MSARVILAAAPLLVAAAASAPSVPFSASQVERGAEVFSTQCAMCHGATGEDAMDWGPQLSGETFWKHWEGRPTRALYSRIISTMPASEPGILRQQDVIDVVAYLSGSEGTGTADVTDPDRLNGVPLRNPDAR